LISRRSLVGSSILVVESAVRLGLVAMVSMWIAHELGPAQFGLLNHASALVAIFWSLALALDTPVTARLTSSTEPGLDLGSAMALRSLAGLLAAALACAAVLLFRNDEPLSVTLTLIVALAVPFSGPYVADAWFKARNEAFAPALARLVATAAACAAKALCLVLGLGVVALAWTVALETALIATALLVAYWWAAERTPAHRLRVRRDRMAEILRSSWPFLLSTFAIAACLKIDVVLLGVLSTNEQTGLYSLGQKLCEVLYVLPVIVVDVLFPQLVRQHAAQPGQRGSDMQLFFDLTFAVALVGTVCAIAVVWFALPVLFGEPYRPTASLFLVQAWACVGVAFAHARFKWMAATGLQSVAPWVTVCGLGLAAILNLLLIPVFGAMGAAIATATAFFGYGYFMSYLFPTLRPAARMQTRALWPWGRLWSEWARARALQAA
jgi:PST family polysaccharide transporter